MCVRGSRARGRSFKIQDELSVAADWRPLQEDVGPPASSAPGSRRPHYGLNPHRVKASKLPALLWTRRSARLKTRPPLRGPHGSPPHGPRTWGPRTSVPPSGPLRNSIPFPSLPDFSPTKLPTPAAAQTLGPLLTCAQTTGGRRLALPQCPPAARAPGAPAGAGRRRGQGGASVSWARPLVLAKHLFTFPLLVHRHAEWGRGGLGTAAGPWLFTSDPARAYLGKVGRG